MKANAEKGSSSLACLSISFPFSSSPLIDGTSVGAGKKSITASNIGWTPLSLYAEPHNTGNNSTAKVPLRIAALISPSVSSSPSRYFIIKSSSNETAASIIFSRYSSACAFIFSGISEYTTFSPLTPSKWTAFIVIKSIKPSNVSSAPIGNWIATALASNLFPIDSTDIIKSAPVASILLQKTILGTP